MQIYAQILVISLARPAALATTARRVCAIYCRRRRRHPRSFDLSLFFSRPLRNSVLSFSTSFSSRLSFSFFPSPLRALIRLSFHSLSLSHAPTVALSSASSLQLTLLCTSSTTIPQFAPTIPLLARPRVFYPPHATGVGWVVIYNTWSHPPTPIYSPFERIARNLSRERIFLDERDVSFRIYFYCQ